MTELEIMMRAKMYIESLANGIDPLSGQEVRADDIVNNVRISRCLFYVSGVLQKVIDNGGEVQRKSSARSGKANFSLTDEQKQNLTPESYALSSSKITAAINSMIDATVMKKLKVTTLNKWLVSAGLLTEITEASGRTRKAPTPDGEALGLQETVFTDNKGTHKYVVYDKGAQQFIFDNIDAVIEFARLEETEKVAESDEAIVAETPEQPL